MKKKHILLIILPCSLIIIAICSCVLKKYYDTKSQLPFSEKHTIIFDTDMGADDAMALLMLAKAPNINIAGVTTLQGNVSIKQCEKNALAVLELAEHPDIKVYPGSKTMLSGEAIKIFSVFGKDGLGDRNLVHPTGKAEDKDAIEFIIETVASNPGKIEIFSVGPMTNIAKAIKRNPKVMSKVKKIWSMGTGGTHVVGNASPLAEFNVYLDALAYHIVVDSKIPMMIIGLDICMKNSLLVTENCLEEWRKMGKYGEFLAESQQGILDYYKKQGLKAMAICDPIAVAAMIWKGFVTKTKCCHPDVITDHALCKGAVMFFEKGNRYDLLNVNDFCTDVVTDVRSECYFDAVKRLLSQ